ncbi:MAG TPA: PTS sugar transporter subunit IIB [Clostridiales bacterium]|nr:PTS sugar transporter subunit IIB [Clostridiales bacterium]
MEIKNVRIDARGIHGQVATSWTRHLGINRIMVIDDSIIKNDMQKLALKMACPEEVKLSIFSCEKAVERLNDPEAYVGEMLMIILINVDTLARLKALNYHFKEVNIGNLPSRPNTEAVRKTVYITEEEKKIIFDVEKTGTHFIAQMVPRDSPVDFISLLK